jgi:hypothetical protein
MEDNFLQKFLKSGLFDIGDSDDRLKWLQQSIAKLQKKFENNYSLLHKHTLVALDPNISDNEPVMIETETIITTYWKALRGKYNEMPRNIIRGVILNALNNVGTTDPLAARIIYLTALNYYPYAKLNKEKNIVNEMLDALGEIAEKNAVEEWLLIEEEPTLKLGTLKISDFKFSAIELDNSQLKEGMQVAIQNEPTGHGSNHGGNSEWGPHFATKSSEAISRAFKAALNEFNKSLSPTALETPINKFFADFKKSLDTNLRASFSSLTAVERRSKLLWWKETLYSSSQKRSYRGFDKNIFPILMGSDLNDLLPEITPISVDYLLRDTLFLLIDKQDSSFKFSDYLIEISRDDLKPILKSCFGNVIEREGRISITDFFALLVNNKISIKDFKTRTGIGTSEKTTLTELSVVVLHDLLTQRLISE